MIMSLKMAKLNVLNKTEALDNFFFTYSSMEMLSTKNKVELLEFLGNYQGEGDKEDPENYAPDDVFISVASAATGIEEDEFVKHALVYFKHSTA